MAAADSKWIDDPAPGDLVSAVAHMTLERRLGLVVAYLPAAAERADEDIEHVHRLRVSTRRAAAAMGLYAPFLPKKRGQQLKKALRRVRRAAGEARDFDVLAERLASELSADDPLVAHIQRQRAAAQPAIVAVHQRLTGERDLAADIEDVLSRIRPRNPPEHDPRFGTWAHDQLVAESELFFETTPPEHADLEALHRFRIAAKRLRYTIELLVAAVSPEVRGDVYGATVELQDNLGAVNDHVSALAHFERWLAQAQSPDLKRAIEQRCEQERTQLDEATRQFDAWWTPEQLVDLRLRITELGRITEP